MKNHESGSVILRSLPQVKSQNRRRGNAIPAWHGPLFFQLPAMGIAQLFHKPPPQLLPGLHGRTQQRPVKGAAQSVWSLSGTAGGNGFQQILPAQGRADGLGAIVAPGCRAEGGQSFFFYVHALTVGSASFRVKTPFPAVHPGAGRQFLPTLPRRRRSLSGKPPAGFQARSQFLKGNGSIQTEAHPVFLIHMVGRKTAAIIRKNPGLTGTNPQVQNLHPFLGTAPQLQARHSQKSGVPFFRILPPHHCVPRKLPPQEFQFLPVSFTDVRDEAPGGSRLEKSGSKQHSATCHSSSSYSLRSILVRNLSSVPGSACRIFFPSASCTVA